MQEIWKDINGFVGKYQVSNYGRVKSLARLRKSKGGCLCPVKERILKPKIDDDGYLNYTFSNGKHNKSKFIRLNILVYQTFIGPVPIGYDIHHINHNRQDNRLENLCLIEHKKHCDLHSSEKSKPILQFTKDGQFVDEFPSIEEASRQTGICRCSIRRCCHRHKKNKTAGGYIFLFKSEVNKINERVKEAKTRKGKQVAQITKDGQLVNVFNSIAEAARNVSINPQNIESCLSKKTKSSCGFVWKYLSDLEELTVA